MNRCHQILAAALALLVASCAEPVTERDPTPATPVGIAHAYAGPGAPTIRTHGLLSAKDEVRLSFKVAGVIQQLTPREGDTVRKGQKLGEIEQTEVRAQVEQARQQFLKAQRDAQRGERLHADQVISLEQLEDLRTQLAVAQAALRAAEFNYEHATIVAPRDGTIARRLAEERELVAAGAPVLVLATEDLGFVVRAGLADREVLQVELGDPAEIRLDARPDVVLHGQVTELATAANPHTGLFDVGVVVAEDSVTLKSGLIAKLSIVPAAARRSELVYVPISAIVEGHGDRASVFVPHAGQAQRRTVQIAFIQDEAVALSGGIRAGDPVITDGALYLADGTAIAIQSEDLGGLTQDSQRTQSPGSE